jgi:hypothetical protein
MPKLNLLFALEYGNSLELNRLEQSSGPDAINFVGRAARNNGVTARISPVPGLAPTPAGTITVALNGQGGAGVAFLQPRPYYSGFHVMVLTPKKPMAEQEKLWWAMCITANRFRFGFGRQANRTLKDIDLPDPEEMPGWVHAVDFGKIFATTLNQLKQLSNSSRATAPVTIGKTRARVAEIFDVAYGTSLELNRLADDPAGINFIARTAKNNGITAKVALPQGVEPIAGDCLSVAVSGSVLETFVQTESFLTGFHIMVLRPKKPMSTEELMFYAACVRANQWRYNYGRQANRTLKDLMVPTRESIPRWVLGSFARVAEQLIQTI